MDVSGSYFGVFLWKMLPEIVPGEGRTYCQNNTCNTCLPYDHYTICSLLFYFVKGSDDYKWIQFGKSILSRRSWRSACGFVNVYKTIKTLKWKQTISNMSKFYLSTKLQNGLIGVAVGSDIFSFTLQTNGRSGCTGAIISPNILSIEVKRKILHLHFK